VEAYSSGSAPSGRVNLRAVEFMRERGYDLSTHVSKSLDQIPAVEYDVAVTIGCGDACPLVRLALSGNVSFYDYARRGNQTLASTRD
jgi:arsenate reductase